MYLKIEVCRARKNQVESAGPLYTYEKNSVERRRAAENSCWSERHVFFLLQTFVKTKLEAAIGELVSSSTFSFQRTRYFIAIRATLLISKTRLSRNISRFLLLRVNKALLYLVYASTMTKDTRPSSSPAKSKFSVCQGRDGCTKVSKRALASSFLDS